MKHLSLAASFLILFLLGNAQRSPKSICAEEMDTMRVHISDKVDYQVVSTLKAAIPQIDSVLMVALQSDTTQWRLVEWKVVTKLYLLKGYCYEQQDQFLEAKQEYENALSIVERFEIQNPDIVSFLYASMGNVYSRLEETTQAGLFLERCVQMLRDSSAFRTAARRSSDLAISLQSRGLLKQGIKVLSNALAYPENSEDTHGRLHKIMTGILLDSFERAPNPMLLQLAEIHSDSAYYWVQAVYGRSPNFEKEVSSVVWLKGKLAYLSGDWKASEKYFERAVRAEISDEEGTNRGLAKVLVQYAKMRMRENNPTAALALYQALLHALIPSCPKDSMSINPISAEIYSEYTIIDGLAGKAEAILRCNEEISQDPKWLRTAWEACQLAFQAEDSMRAIYTYEETILSLATESHQRMEIGLELLFRLRGLGDPAASDEAIHQVFERNQGQLMGEYLKGLANNGLVPPALREREIQARLEIREYSQRIDEESDPKRLRQWREKLQAAGQALNTVKDSIRKRNPSFYAFRYAPTVVPLAKVQSEVLDTGTCLIHYFWGEQSVFRLVILKDRVLFDKLGSVAEIKPHLEFLGDPETAKNRGTLPEDLYQLYKLLWEDRANDIPLRVAIVPDGPLWQVPFEALLTGKEDDLGYQSPYLIRKHSVYYAFSASIQWWLEQVEHHPAITSGYLGLMPSLEGDPNLALSSQDRPSLTAFASDFGGQCYEGKSANRTTLAQSNGYAAVLHINSHATWNAQRPYDSYIALESTSGAGEVDTFHLGDILSMRPKGQLVVLEACTSGVGNVRSGEGMESIAKGFVLSGATGVISTNRAVNAACSANLIDRFFEGLAQGKSIDLTLRSAKLAYLKDESLQRKDVMPWVWGAFRPYGSMKPLPLKPVSKGFSWLVIGGGLLALLAVVWLLFRRRFPAPNLPNG